MVRTDYQKASGLRLFDFAQDRPEHGRGAAGDFRPRADRSDVPVSRRAFLLAVATGWSCRRQGRSGARPAAPDRVAEIEWHILFLTNQQRLWQKLPPFEASPALADVARGHSRDMLDREFFNHVNPEGLSPKDRVGKRGLAFTLVAENIYSTSDGTRDPAKLASTAVTGWMNTTGHRRNILNPSLTQLGVGVAISERQILATQLFGG
jgi:uncharacterized protein YkwD